MGDDDARLNIDYWYTTVSAAVRRADHEVAPVLVDGDVVTPTGVAVTEDGRLHPGRAGAIIAAERPELYVRTPGQRLFDERVRVGAVSVDPVDLVAATISLVAQRVGAASGGSSPADVVICVPSGWVGRQHERVRTAARRAGLAQPRVLDGADAIVRDQIAAGVPVPLGAEVVVCRLDATVGEVVVLCRRADGMERLAAHVVGEVGETPGVTLVEQAATALASALEAAEIPGDRVAAVFCHAPDAMMTALVMTLPASAGLTVTPVRVGDLAAAFGAMHTTVPTRPMKAKWRFAKLFYSLGGIVAGGGGAALLAYQLFNSGQVYEATSTSPETFITQWCAWGLASVLALLALVSTALAVSDVRTIRSGTVRQTGPDPNLGSALVFAAALGVGLAAVFALIGGASFGVDPLPILAWTVGSTLVMAGAVATLGVLASRLPTAKAWRDRLRFPVEASVLAAASTVAVVGSYVAIPIGDRNAWWSMEHLGALGMGWAVAYLVTRRPIRLAIVGALLGGSATFAISLDTFDAIGAFLIGAITVWWLARLVQVVGPVLPRLVAPGAPPTPVAPVGSPDGG